MGKEGKGSIYSEAAKGIPIEEASMPYKGKSAGITNFIRSYLHQFFNDSHGLKASLKPLRRPFDQYQLSESQTPCRN